MPQHHAYIKDVPSFLAMTIEERAQVLLRFIHAHFPKTHSVNRRNVINPDTLRTAYPGERDVLGSFRTALSEAWLWLEREILIAPAPDQDRDWVYVTERGEAFLQNESPVAWSAAGLLLRETFDPELAAEIGAAWRRGNFTRAVGNAFLTVELRVRKLAGVGDAKIDPQDLMGKVFGEGGALRHPAHDKDKASGVRALFQAAMARYRNPHLHDSEQVETSAAGLRRIQFADLLLTTAEEHAQAVRAAKGS